MKRTLSLAALLGAATAASAHTGHGTHGLLEGLAHPLAMDHLLAMVAVGLWSALALPAGRRLAGPATFLAAMAAGAALGALGVGLPLVEQGIALSVGLFGAMLMAGRLLPAGAGLVAVAVAAVLHGLAHGAELPAGASFAGYAAGFLATSALLHGAGLGLATRLQGLTLRVWQIVGGALGLAGLTLLARL
ncbi:HupE/UreJ family protein [Ideonella sp. A 288]|uniref:HupE/UreJ family protein n=1 Tax=Ideonella sp. A 288 TaxID=1962181 RepID=UPI000B4BFED3|nr:HupE/UreJ family protein [Ideonella sp. A 288]